MAHFNDKKTAIRDNIGNTSKQHNAPHLQGAVDQTNWG